MSSEDTKILDRELTKLRRAQASRVMPVVASLLDFWEMLPGDEKDLVRTNPRLSCLLDELEAAMEYEESPERKRERATLHQQNLQLRTALRPFVSEAMRKGVSGTRPDNETIHVDVEIGDVRRGIAALLGRSP